MALYKKLSDPIMDDAMRKSRQRMGLEMIEIEECKTWMDNHVSEGGSQWQSVLGLIKALKIQ